MRLYVRVENVNELSNDLIGEQCHMKLLIGTVMMRTRNQQVSSNGMIDFTSMFKKSEMTSQDELFVFYVKSIEQLAQLTLRVQLRRHRLILRSDRTAEARIPLALLGDGQRALRGSFPLRKFSREDTDHHSSAPVVGKGTFHIEVDLATPLRGITIPAVEETEDAVPPAIEEPVALISAVPPPRKRSPTAASSPGKAIKVPPKVRTHGTQTDRLTMDASDFLAMTKDIEVPPSEYEIPMARLYLDPPPSAAVWAPQTSRLPAAVLAHQATLPAHPTDDMEGLLLFCDHAATYQRELEATLARHQIDTVRSKVQAFRAVNESSMMSTSTPRGRGSGKYDRHHVVYADPLTVGDSAETSMLRRRKASEDLDRLVQSL